MDNIDKLVWFFIIFVYAVGFLAGYKSWIIILIAVFLIAIGIGGMAHKSESVMKTFGDYKPAIIIPTTTAGFAFIGVIVGYFI